MMRVSFTGAGLFVTTVLLATVALCAALAAASLAAHTHAEAARADGGLMVRVLAPATPQGVIAATKVLRDTPGVSSAQAMDGVRAAALLTAWGGGAVDPKDLPALHLIEVRRAPEADARIADYLRGAGIRAELYGAGPGDTGAARRAHLATNAALTAVAALLLTIALTFAAAAQFRGASAALAAELGGLRGDSLAAYGRSACATAFLAGGTAAILCTLGAPGVLMTMGEALSLKAMIARISPAETALVLLAPLLTAAAATLGARAGAARAFDRADRLR